jgi:CubicO group peptidase (beta-lactamase class C family)
MRRVLTILSASLLVLVSLGIGVLTADLPFWRRALQLPLASDATYQPVAVMGEGPVAQDRVAVAAVPVRHSSEPTPGLATGSLAELAALAERAARTEPSAPAQDGAATRGSGMRALLVVHRGRTILERYFGGDSPDTLMPADVIARPLSAMAVGLAVAEGRIASLEAPISTWLGEWAGEPRGRITVRQLLEETSGLETGGARRDLLHRSPFSVPAALPWFATSRGVRMLLGNDYESSALAFRLAHEPGGFRDLSPANPQLTAVIIERASGEPYERYLERRLWRPLGGSRAELQLDRRAGMPAAHCCWRATARDMMAVAALIAADGRKGSEQLLPAGWVRQMATPSRVSAQTGLHLTLLELNEVPALEATTDYGAFWSVPDEELAILALHRDTAETIRIEELRALAWSLAAAVSPGPERK